MIDLSTGRFCLAHSMQLLWYTGEVERALYGLPSRAEVAGHPLTDLLCEYHRWYFHYMPISLAMRDDEGQLRTYPNGVLMSHMVGKVVRPNGPTKHDLSKLELLTMLERMENGLRLLQAEQNAGFVHDETTQDTCTLEDVVERAKLHRSVQDYLRLARTTPLDSNPFSHGMTLADWLDDRSDHSDRISGEE